MTEGSKKNLSSFCRMGDMNHISPCISQKGRGPLPARHLFFLFGMFLCLPIVLSGNDYRRHLEKAIEVMSTQTMSYEKETGMGKMVNTSLLIQERKADGRMFRREELLVFGKAVSREELSRGMEQLTYYFTDEGYTAVFTTREKIRAVRAPGELSKHTIPRDATFSGEEKNVDAHGCWVIRAKGEVMGRNRIYEYTVDKESHVIRAYRIFDENGRLLMRVSRKNFSFTPQIPPDTFRIPKLDEIFFAKNMEKLGDAFKRLHESEAKYYLNSSPEDKRPRGLSQKLRYISRNPALAVRWGLLGVSGLFLGVTAILKIRQKQKK